MSDPRREPFCVIGLGQLGRLVGAGLLARGHEVLPISRSTPPAVRERALGAAERVLVAVGETDLTAVLDAIPPRLRAGRIWLLQNELLPPVWQARGVTAPTVMVVWCEKKRGKPLTVIQPTLVGGPDATSAVQALAEVDVPAKEIDDTELTSALVDKNLYILVSNLAGLAVGGTVGELSVAHRTRCDELAAEVLSIEAAELGTSLDPAAYLSRLHANFALDPEHACRGRSAEARLARLLDRGARLGVATPISSALRTGRTTAGS